MTVDLLPSYTRGLTPAFVTEPLDAAPNYVRSRAATRWHRARSGHTYATGRVSYLYWCGAGATAGTGVDELPDGDDLCGTCEGRYLAQLDGHLAFTPIASLPPRVCPASGVQSDAWIPHTRSFPCPVCGLDVTAPAVSCFYAGRHIIRHTPGPGLVDPCRIHGWFHLQLINGVIACACTESRAA